MLFRYHLKDVIVGKIYFLLVRIKIKHMEIAILKKESTGSGPNIYAETETVAKYEIMDGAPVRGESIPIRLFLGGYDLTPTMKDVQRKFSVRYFLNLVLVDEEERRYFKQQVSFRNLFDEKTTNFIFRKSFFGENKIKSNKRILRNNMLILNLQIQLLNQKIVSLV